MSNFLSLIDGVNIQKKKSKRLHKYWNTETEAENNYLINQFINQKKINLHLFW